MRGYKILEHDLRCHPVAPAGCSFSRQCEKLAKQYTIPGTFEEKLAIVGVRGMHFATKITNLPFGKFLAHNSVVVEVEATKYVDTLDIKRCPGYCFVLGKVLIFKNAIVATTNLRIIRKLEPQEVWDLFLSELREYSAQDRDAAHYLANEFWFKVSEGYFDGVKNLTRKEFEERTTLTDTYWSENLK